MRSVIDKQRVFPVEIVAVHIHPAPPAEKIQLMFDRVSESRRQQASRYKFQEDAIRSLTGELLLARLLKEKHGCVGSELLFHKNAYGKPLLIAPFTQHFNVSHSGDWVICGLHDSDIGVDVEVMKPIEVEHFERIFTVKEMQWLMSIVSGEERMRGFYSLWTLKESYIKAVGQGLSMPLDSFDVLSFVSGSMAAQSANPSLIKDYDLRLTTLDEKHQLAVCIHGQIHELNVVKTDLSTLLDEQEQ